MKIINDHQTRTSVTSKVKSRSLKLELSESDNLSNSDASDASDALSKYFKWIIIKSVDYRALNNFWVRDYNWNFVSKAIWIQIKLNTSQTVKHAKASLDWKQWKLDAHIKNDIFILKISSLNQWILSMHWVTIIKWKFKEKIIKYKAKWVCKKFHQK